MAAPDFAGIATKQVGPLPLFAWVGIAGVGILILRSRAGATAAQTMGLGTVTAIPNPSMASASTPAQILNPGQAVAIPGGGYSSNPSLLSNLFGGMNLSSFITGLGPDYTGVSVSEGDANVSVAHHNTAADLQALNITEAYGLWKQQFHDYSSLVALNNTNAYGFWNNELAGYWADILTQHHGTVLNAGQTYVPGGGASIVGTSPTVTVFNNPLSGGNY